ncbi:MAG: nucleoside-triphosphatase [Oscillospiraceae bacterium]|nr:nucleoside-triphosphatase [Oscillospiraceae bacterium]
MHIFLTGAIRTGKSTAIARVLAQTTRNIGGFCTAFDENRGKEHWKLYLYPAGGPRAMDEAHLVANFKQGTPPVVLPNRFAELGVPILDAARDTAELIIMDECGRLEGRDLPFQNAILQTLDASTPVLGVVREGLPGWTGAIAAHPKVSVLYLTVENRDRLTADLSAWISDTVSTKFLRDKYGFLVRI